MPFKEPPGRVLCDNAITLIGAIHIFLANSLTKGFTLFPKDNLKLYGCDVKFQTKSLQRDLLTPLQYTSPKQRRYSGSVMNFTSFCKFYGIKVR